MARRALVHKLMHGIDREEKEMASTADEAQQPPRKKFKSGAFGDNESEPMKINTSKAQKQENTIRLPEEDPELVEQFFKLAFYRIDMKLELLQPIFVHHSHSGRMLVRLFVLVDKLGAEAQQNKVMDLLRANLAIYALPEKSLETLLHAGLENSKLFHMLTTQLAWEMKEHWQDGWDIYDFYPDFIDWLEKGGPAVREVVRMMIELRSLESQSLTVDDWARPEVLCKWHSHNSTPPCVP